MTLADRAAAFAQAYPRWPASWPHVVREQGRDVLYATWVLGNDYRNRSGYYGAYPPGYLDRVRALFPDVPPAGTLHVFAGLVPPAAGVRLDLNPAVAPDVVGSVYDAPQLLAGRGRFSLVVADPPYTARDAARYGAGPLDRRRALAALAGVTAARWFLVWLDAVWPMHNKREWLTVGRIFVQRSTNHRVRVCSLFERVA